MTPRMWKVLQAIDAHIAANGYSPSLAEIAADTGVASRTYVHKTVNALIDRGFLHRHGLGTTRRNIAITTTGRAALAAQTLVTTPALTAPNERTTA